MKAKMQDYGYKTAPIQVEVYEEVKRIAQKKGMKINRMLSDLVLKGLEAMRMEG